MRTRAVGVVGLAVLLLGVPYGVNVGRNLDAAHRVAAACDALGREPTIPDALRAVPGFEEVPGDTLIVDIRRENELLCSALASELSWYRWNWGRAVVAPNDVDLVSRIDDSLHRASTRCRMYARWAGIPGGERSYECCGWIEAAKAAHLAQHVGMPVWDWPLAMDKIAAMARPAPWPGSGP
jgi:hypothetical protein